jgi:hypothetical protein
MFRYIIRWLLWEVLVNFLKRSNMFNEIRSKIEKTNDQRIAMALTLINVMKQTEKVSIEIRTAVAAAMIDMLDTHMIDEDRDLIKVINDGIDSVCNDAEKNHGVKNLRQSLRGIIATSKEVIAQQINRVNEGESILKSINLN